MNELQTIREALKLADNRAFEEGNDCGPFALALEALDVLEAREASFATAGEIVDIIQEEIMEVGGEYIHKISSIEGETLIGQYAYRYSEDIRKDRDYWKKTAESLHDAILQHVENHKGDKPIDLGGPSPVSKLATKLFSECQGCEGQGLDCAESCLRPKK
jgi:hypothetical protein